MGKVSIRSAAFWTTTVFGPASFVIGGVLHLAHASQTTQTLAHLGYPGYFAWILGVGNLLGALIIVAPGLPRLKEWAYAGFFFNLTSAAFSRAAVGDGSADIIAPLGFLALVLASWWLRPESRKLSDSTSAENAGRLKSRPLHKLAPATQFAPVGDTL